MKRVLIATVALALGACASGSGSTSGAKTPAEMILGKWNCKATAEGVTTDAAVTYLAGGTATMDAKVGVNQSGMAIDITATADASIVSTAGGHAMDRIDLAPLAAPAV